MVIHMSEKCPKVYIRLLICTNLTAPTLLFPFLELLVLLIFV